MTMLPRAMDERFWEFRRRSTSIAGIVGGVLALLLFAFRFYHDHVWSWDLLAVGLTFVGVKLVLMAYFYATQ
jgi:hypothetical protein